MLALGSDPTLSGLAEQELVAPESADGQAELADAWWKYAENADGPVKEATRTRAGRWYHQALPGLSGLPKVKAERRLQELAKLGISDRRPIVGPTSRREPLVRPTSPRKYQPVNLLALIDPKKDNYRQGAKWSFNQGSLIATRRGWGQLPRVKVPYIPPDEYDLDLEVTRLAAVHTKGGQALRIGLAGGQNRFQVIVDGGMPFRTSICHVDVQNPESKDNPTVVTATVLSTGRRTKIRCEVRNEGVKVSADGKTLIDWRGGFDRISIDKAWAAPNGLPLHLGRGDKTALAVHSLVLTPISGPGRALRNGN
jgi:hypothetical protein